tara:strand:- start:51 stop:488 length:438 start_codon:yes stop_codon:yes gene_type:complete
MAGFRYNPGVGNVGSYQVSGRPFLTGSTVVSGSDADTTDGVIIEFPSVTKRIIIRNTGIATAASLMIHFDSKANPNVINNHHYWRLDPELMTDLDTLSYFDAEFKCRKLYVSVAPNATGSTEFELFAELTGIKQEYILSGSGINE